MRPAREWTPEQEAELLELRASGLSEKKLARLLGRTQISIECKLVELTPAVDWNAAAIRRASARFAADIARMGR